MGLLDILGSFVKPLTDLIGKFSDNDEKKAQLTTAVSQAQIAVADKLVGYEMQIATLQGQVITAEVNSTSWITKSWRPITALLFVGIVVFNYVGTACGLKVPPIEPDMWSVIKIMIGGYVGGRSLEKIVPAVAAIVKNSGQQ